MPLHVGTSGWQYRDWRRTLLPALACQHVTGSPSTPHPSRPWRSNASFYRLPERSTFTHWAARVPPDERFARQGQPATSPTSGGCGSPAEPVTRPDEARRGTRRPAGAGPAATAADAAGRPGRSRRDAGLLSRRDAGRRRGPASVLVGGGRCRRGGGGCSKARGAALCWADRLGRPVVPLWRTAGWGYLRLHEGPAPPHVRRMARQALAHWVERVCDTFRRRRGTCSSTPTTMRVGRRCGTRSGSPAWQRPPAAEPSPVHPPWRT